MSLVESLRFSLLSMGFLQLGLAFAALLAYSLALSPGLTPGTRVGAAGASSVGAVGFAVATPQWVDGIVLMALAVAGCGLFAGMTWLLARVLGVGAADGSLIVQSVAIRDEAELAPPPTHPPEGIVVPI